MTLINSNSTLSDLNEIAKALSINISLEFLGDNKVQIAWQEQTVKADWQNLCVNGTHYLDISSAQKSADFSQAVKAIRIAKEHKAMLKSLGDQFSDEALESFQYYLEAQTSL